MQDNYLNINFKSYAKKEDVPDEADNIVLIVTKEQAERFEFQNSLAQNIDNSLSFPHSNRIAIAILIGIL